MLAVPYLRATLARPVSSVKPGLAGRFGGDGFGKPRSRTSQDYSGFSLLSRHGIHLITSRSHLKGRKGRRLPQQPRSGARRRLCDGHFDRDYEVTPWRAYGNVYSVMKQIQAIPYRILVRLKTDSHRETN